MRKYFTIYFFKYLKIFTMEFTKQTAQYVKSHEKDIVGDE